MKVIRIATVIIACLALLGCFGIAGAYEVGHLTALEALALCVASCGLLCVSVKIYNKVQEKEKDE